MQVVVAQGSGVIRIAGEDIPYGPGTFLELTEAEIESIERMGVIVFGSPSEGDSEEDIAIDGEEE